MSQLPSGTEPLVLADGRKVLPSGVIIPSVAQQADATQEAVASATPAPVEQELATAVERPPPNLATIPRRRIGDLPDVPKVINAVNVVVAYSLFGMSDDDICVATKLTEVQLERMRESDAYAVMRDTIVRGVLDAEAQSVRDLFVQHARAATMTVVQSLHAGSRADRLSAAKDILDRAGHRPADVVEHRHRMDGGLVIEIVRRDQNEVPTIDMGVGDD